jgi:16S rRNA (adenine1518-N6/adenine1519-N6)-dimethyltransferase
LSETAALTSPSRVRDLLQQHGLRPDRAFGQNFLVDSNALSAIVAAAGLSGQETVVEFGPGLGVLTVRLAQHAAQVVSVELDSRLLPVLAETLSGLPNITLLNEDALDFDYSRLPAGSRLVANLPYNVATPLVMAALESGVIARIVVMVQREVAERMVASPGDPGFGAFSLLISYYASARIVRHVAPGCFFPPPEVTSSIVSLDVHSDVRPDPELFTLIHDAFRHRRKTLKKNLKMAGRPEAATDSALAALRLEPRVRAEELTLEQFRSLYRELVASD